MITLNGFYKKPANSTQTHHALQVFSLYLSLPKSAVSLLNKNTPQNNRTFRVL
ncbi:transcriptional regulator, AsnC family [Aggregatibacter aphrophilus NJ8700]|nr:transcriptional regulator, AsnC family [Aggregatibacter aphrophilus NJ8700]